MIRSGTYTVCLDTSKANEDSYCNWVTVKVLRDAKGTYRLLRLSNAAGNGQTWDAFGSVVNGRLALVGAPTFMLRGVATVMARNWNLTTNRLLPVNFPKARIWNTSRTKGRKTAAPSLLRDHVRDKNKNNMREHVKGIDLATAMAARNWAAKHG